MEMRSVDEVIFKIEEEKNTMKLFLMKRLALVGSLVLTVFLLAACFAESEPPTPVQAPEQEAAARTLVGFLVEGQFKEVHQMFNAEMATALPSAELEATWTGLLGQVGEFKEITESKATEKEGKIIIDVVCEFANGPLNARVVFDAENKVAGLHFLPVQ
jgi:PBP1b-binding outer membrane lipoprotein LpoB